MAERKWNDRQKDAIISRNGTVIVSAAAGSGKTAVLVERVVERLCDETAKCPANELLIVTFTKAAASELRHRINKALQKRIKLNPNNIYLIKQQRLLASAVIGTMDSFCSQIVRENFWLCDVSPDYRILDSAEEKLLMRQAADNVLEPLYESKEKSFVDLLELFGSDKNDKALVENIFNCYFYSMAYPFPEKWLNSLLNEYDPEKMAKEIASGKEILSYISLMLDGCIDTMNNALEYCQAHEELNEKYTPLFESELSYFKKMKSLSDSKQWDSLFVELNNADSAFQKLPPIKGSDKNTYEKAAAQSLRNKAKSTVKELYKSMPVVSTQHRDDMEALFAPLECFTKIVLSFSQELLSLKKDKNAYGFSDISHFALKMLVDDNSNKTELSEKLSSQFCEIFIDEYQDTNKAQDMLFEAVSRNGENMFIVGDVKQSIYRFRKAMPEIFIERRNNYDYYDSKRDNYPSKIILDSNYRSRKSVIDSVNFFFSSLMSKRVGEIDYNEDEKLNFAADFSSNDEKTEIHYFPASFEASEITEGRHVAKEIERMVSEKMTIKDGDKIRPVRYGDFCILMRSVKNKGADIASELRKRNIPSFCDASDSFCTLPEIATVLSLLRAVDNPLNDVALLSVLFSPIYGFTPDELAEIRITGGKKSLYLCLADYAEKSEKAKKVLKDLSDFRKYSVVCSAEEMLRKLYTQTGFVEIVRAMQNGSIRTNNLNHLLDYAKVFEKNGAFGLSEFIRFIDKVSENGGDIQAVSSSGFALNSVRIMTIHKSKGLEFPVVFIANCNSNLIHSSSEPSNILLNPRTKIGVKRQDREKLFRYSTVPYSGAKLANETDDISEELRVLYVAMTRAKEKLIFVITDGKNNKSLSIKNIPTFITNGKINPADVLSMKNYAKWILTCALLDKQNENLRQMLEAEIPTEMLVDGNTSFSVYDVDADDCTETENERKTVISEELNSEISERINFVYPYNALVYAAAKRTASDLNEQKINTDYFAAEKPAFMSKDSFTPAQRGTLVHKFMEKADYSACEKSVTSQLDKLFEKGEFSEKEKDAVDIKKIKAFFGSDLYMRIKSSTAVYREQQFTISIDAKMLIDSLPSDSENEQIVIQGKIDCFFEENGEFVILDYKTDRVKDSSELALRYKTQMDVYKTAVEKFTGKRVKEVVLYSFNLGKEIKLK